MDRSKHVVTPLVRRAVKGQWRRAGALATLSAIALAVLHGCASAPGGEESSDLVCHSAQQRRVRVEVNCGASGCRASVDHPRVLARGNDVVWIVDNKAGQSYAFPTDDGIFFKTEPGRNTFRCHREANGNRYACMNGKTRGTFEYGIRITGTPAVPPLDPWVVN